MDPVTVIPDFPSVLKAGKSSEAVLELLFVACARALGFAVRLNPITGEKEYYDGQGYRALTPARQSDATLTLINRSDREMVYGAQLSVGILKNGAYESLHLYGKSLTDTLELPVFAGQYRIMTCTRQIDGSLNGMQYYVTVPRGGAASVEVELPPERVQEAKVCVPLSQLEAVCGGERVTFPGAVKGKNAILAYVAPTQEPSEHFFQELLEAKGLLAEAGVAVRLILQEGADEKNAKLQTVLRELADVAVARFADPVAIRAWREEMHAGDVRLPFAVAVDGAGHGLFAYANYSVGSVQALLRVIGAR